MLLSQGATIAVITRKSGVSDHTYYRWRKEYGSMRVGQVHQRVERIWRKEGLKVPKKQPKRGRLWLNDGSCVRLRPEFTAKAIRTWLNRLGVKTPYIAPGSPWENGYIESFNGKLRGELLNQEILTTLEEAKILIEEWRKEYNQVRSHSAKNYRPPASEAILTMLTT